MKYNFHYHHRRSMRLKGHNYSKAGSYFVTLTCKNRFPLFGEIIKGKMNLNEFGLLAKKEWLKTPSIRPHVSLGALILMPDHLHGIIIIREEMNSSLDSLQTKNEFESSQVSAFESSRDVLHPSLIKNEFGTGRGGCNTPLPVPNSTFRSPSQTLGAIVRGYMGSVTKQINAIRNTSGEMVWQRNYHDHIIRNKWDFKRITHYILMNPKKWEKENQNEKGRK